MDVVGIVGFDEGMVAYGCLRQRPVASGRLEVLGGRPIATQLYELRKRLGIDDLWRLGNEIEPRVIVLSSPGSVAYLFDRHGLLQQLCDDTIRIQRRQGRPTRLDECNLAGGEVIHAADDVDLLVRVKLLDDRRRSLQSSRLPSHILGNRAVEQIACLRLLGDDDGWFDRGDELRQMARKD